MSDDDSQWRERELGKRVASLMQSIGQAPATPITDEEQQRLKAAASRLDQMLKAGADADQQALMNAASRLDQMLVDIRKGRDFTNRLKRREQKEPTR